jgi:hypothetical protein
LIRNEGNWTDEIAPSQILPHRDWMDSGSDVPRFRVSGLSTSGDRIHRDCRDLPWHFDGALDEIFGDKLI